VAPEREEGSDPPSIAASSDAGWGAVVLRLHLNVPSGRKLPLERVDLAVRMIHRRAGREGAGDELSITFLEDDPIRALNRRYLDHDWVPDVLAFTFPEPPPLGDVYVGLDQAVRQARDEGVPLEEELVRLAVHGTLHVLGSEHPEAPEDREASEHYRIQEAVVREVMDGPGDGEAKHEAPGEPGEVDHPGFPHRFRP
jgi:probable rRNA maturation factor